MKKRMPKLVLQRETLLGLDSDLAKDAVAIYPKSAPFVCRTDICAGYPHSAPYVCEPTQ